MKILIRRTIEDSLWCQSIALPKVNEIKKIITLTLCKVWGHQFRDRSFEFGMRFVNNKVIRQYNNDYRGFDKSTDVLSFSEFDFSSRTWSEVFTAYELKNIYLGDIMFGYESVIYDAKILQWPFKNRVLHLVVHATLHLVGFDHIEEEDRIVMEQLEVEILNSFGIPNPYLED